MYEHTTYLCNFTYDIYITSLYDKPQSVNTTLVRKTKCKRLPFEGVLRRGINAGATPSRNQLLYTAVAILNFLWISSYTVIY